MTWLQKGGPVVWPLLLLSLVATTVVIERILFWARARRDPSRLLEIARTGGLDAAERNMARGMVLLDTVVTVAPMLGILGTVLGIIDSFELLSADARPDPLAVSGGIAQALITTAIGLVVALSTILPYNWFRARIRESLSELEHAGKQGRTV
jgi:biopolymer transport protein ExbB